MAHKTHARRRLQQKMSYWPIRSKQQSHYEQRIAAAQRYRQQMRPDLTTPWRSFWSWVLIDDHVRLALVTVLMPLITAPLACKAIRSGVQLSAELSAALWCAALFCLGLTLGLIIVTVVSWRRWERKIRLLNPRIGNAPDTAETEHNSV